MDRCDQCFNLEAFCTCERSEQDFVKELVSTGAVDLRNPELHTGFYL